MAVGVIERQKEGQKTPTRTYSKKQETDIAKAVGGVRTKNSGATLFQKGDILTKKFLLEAHPKHPAPRRSAGIRAGRHRSLPKGKRM